MGTVLFSKMSLNVIIVKLFSHFSKNQFLKNLCSGTQCEGFQFLLILDLWGISFYAVVVVGLGKDLLFKSVLGHCEWGGVKNGETCAQAQSPIIDLNKRFFLRPNTTTA